MKLHLAQTEGRNAVTGYGAGYVEISHIRYDTSLVVTPDQLFLNWPATSSSRIDETVTAFLATLPVEIVLIGTGSSQCFPAPRILRPLIEAGVGFEIMDTMAASRTYNILMAEDRRVAAALVL